MNLVKSQIPPIMVTRVYPVLFLILFRDNRSLRFSVRITSVAALFILGGKYYGVIIYGLAKNNKFNNKT